MAYRNASDRKCVNKYDFDAEGAKKHLTVRVFDKADEEWLEFISANRQEKFTEEYDIIIGSVADDKVYRVVVEYENGDTDKETALKSLKTEKLCNRILFHTAEALKFLKYIDTEIMHGDE